MMLETLRLNTNWLKDPAVGVNFELARLLQDVADNDVPVVEFIGDLSRTRCVADWTEPPTTPALYIVPAAPIAVEGVTETQNYRDADGVPIAIYYIVSEVRPELALTWMMYTLRAIARSLIRLQAGTDEQRTMNSVGLIKLSGLVYGETFEPIGETGALGAVTATWSARDLMP